VALTQKKLQDLTDAGLVGLLEDVGQEVLDLVDPAQDRILPGEDLHRHDRVEALAIEDRLGPREVHVRGIA